MTTNNHPAHGPVSLDRLHQIREILSKAAAQSDGGNLGYAMADAVKVIDGAIAAFGAEPAPVDIEMLATVLRNAPLAPSDRQGRPRALVVPEECKEAPAYVKALTKEGAYIYGFNACRAAMLQAGNSPVIPDDVRRMDWLVSKTVDVREPMVYGSHSLFWSQTITDEEDDYHATKLREQIDAAMAAEQAAAPQQEA